MLNKCRLMFITDASCVLRLCAPAGGLTSVMNSSTVMLSLSQLVLAPNPGTRLPACKSTKDVSNWLADDINTQYKGMMQAGNATVRTTLIQVG